MARSALALLGLVAVLLPMGMATAQPGNSSKLIDMLRDPLLWGPDSPAVLDSVPAFAQAGQAQIEILPRRVVGRQKYERAGEAEKAAGAAMQMMKALPQMRIPVGPVQKDAQRRTLGAVAAVVFPDDRKFHVGTSDREVRYIAANVRIDQVEQRFGKAESVTTEVIDDGTERRPIELTLYHFANGAIIVATANYNTDPRSVDRVLLDTNAVMKAVF
jgi:hypothetical protein